MLSQLQLLGSHSSRFFPLPSPSVGSRLLALWPRSGSGTASRAGFATSEPGAWDLSKSSKRPTNLELFTFGNNTKGQLGLGHNKRVVGVNQIARPTFGPEDREFLSISAGHEHVLAATAVRVGSNPDTASTRYEVFGWGFNAHNVLATGGAKTLRQYQQQESNAAEVLTTPTLSTPLLGIPIVGVSAGHRHSIFLSKDHEVFGIGGSSLGQVGTGLSIKSVVEQDESSVIVPQPVRIEKGGLYDKIKKWRRAAAASGREDKDTLFIKRLQTGFEHNIVLWSDGTLFVWGSNGDSQLGFDIVYDSENPPETDGVDDICFTIPKRLDFSVFSGSKVVDIFANLDNTAVLCEEGSVWTMGNNHWGQLGIGTKDQQPGTPQRVGGALTGKKVKEVAVGWSHMLALTEDGEVYSWGNNDRGQLGTGKKTPLFEPTLIKALSGAKVKKLGCGDSFSMCLTEDGSLLSFGAAEHGQLGHNNTTDRSLPVPIQGLNRNRVIDFSCGSDFTAVLAESER